MENFAVLVFLILTFVSCICSSVDISHQSDEVCLGIAATFTCTVNGTALGWRYGGVGAGPELFGASGGITNLNLLGSGPFSTRVTNVTGGVMTSIATTSNLTRDADGMTLECSNGSFSSGTTEIASVTLPLQDSSVPTSLVVSYTQVGTLNVTWTKATCTSFYRVYVNKTFLTDTVGTSFFYNPPSPGIYFFQVNSTDYFGVNVGSIPSLPYPWLVPTTIFRFNVNSSGLIVSFEKDSNDIGQPPVNYCVIILNDISTACQISETYIFPIRDRVNYTYNVTVRNVVGPKSKTGDLKDLIRPTSVTIGIPVTQVVTSGYSATGDPAIFALPFIVLGVLIILSVGWIVLRICWKRQCCCPRIWRSSFWLIFFCYDCCTHNAEETEGNTIGLKDPNIEGEKGTDTSL